MEGFDPQVAAAEDEANQAGFLLKEARPFTQANVALKSAQLWEKSGRIQGWSIFLVH